MRGCKGRHQDVASQGPVRAGIAKHIRTCRLCRRADVGEVARTSHSLNLSSITRPLGPCAWPIRNKALAEFERTGRISWNSDLADIPRIMARPDSV